MFQRASLAPGRICWAQADRKALANTTGKLELYWKAGSKHFVRLLTNCEAKRFCELFEVRTLG